MRRLKAKIQERRGWGGWHYDPELYVLILMEGKKFIYEIDIERIESSAQILDWIAQLRSKKWMTDANLAGLVRALDDLLNFQANYCGCGQDHRIAAKSLLTVVDPERKWG